MTQLEPFLRVDQPADVSPAALQRFADQNRCHDCTVDAWGNPLVVVREVDADGKAHYEVRSMGSDGKLGPCCAYLAADGVAGGSADILFASARKGDVLAALRGGAVDLPQSQLGTVMGQVQRATTKDRSVCFG